jgi:hypothetical protein
MDPSTETDGHIFVKNGAAFPLFIAASVEGGWIIFVARTAPHEGALEVAPGMLFELVIDDDVHACRSPHRLQVKFKTAFTASTKTYRRNGHDGPIIEITPKLS